MSKFFLIRRLVGVAALLGGSMLIVGSPAQAVGGGAPSGYWFVASDGGIFSFGPGALFQGSAGDIRLAQPIVGMAGTPDGAGYWLVARDGGIFTYGDAVFHGSTGATHLNQPIVGMAATRDGGGYWLVAADGGVFTFGDATFHGSALGQVSPFLPAVSIAADANGSGYWILRSDGLVIPFGAPDLGSYLAPPGDRAVALASAPQGGWWLATASGGVVNSSSEGASQTGPNVQNHGQVTGHLNAPIVGMTSTPDGQGYWLLGADGGVFSFGDATFFGSTGEMRLNGPVVGITASDRPASGAQIVLRDDNNGDVVTVHVGDHISIVLNQPQIDGFQWSLTRQPPPNVLRYDGEQDQPGTQTFPFTAVGVGRGNIQITPSNTTFGPGAPDNFGVIVTP
jgi:hypothetical protein